ncbi:MAG: PhnD/SsuA/transferrin family substrate-binding protein [Melioribacter sp.]|uniref:PhnD/SsuA/transferrin family substrate-binding protein n=1 Tax=Rosettibacter primus TaxID=3111523 RepID=UPI00247E030F|nr:PhnD/SsuA/transferrin family substrate-binding protein [Melioribacter sp.]
MQYAQSDKTILRWALYFPTIEQNYMKQINESWDYWSKLFIKKLNNQGLEGGKFSVQQYYSKTQLLEDIKNNKIDAIALFSIHYVNEGFDKFFYPVFTSSKSLEEKFQRYIIICNVENQLSNINNAELHIPKSSESDLMDIWVKSRFGVDKSANGIVFVKSPKNEIQLINAIFFGSIKYAVVTEASFSVAKELNPQIKNKIKVIDTSTGLINLIIALRKGYNKDFENIILDISLNFHNSTEGRQILNLAQAARFVAINNSDLSETIKLLKSVKKRLP